MGDRPDVTDILPLTPAQQGILLHSIGSAGQGTYVNQVVVTLTGTIDPDLLRTCWEETVRRHDALRAAFLWEDLDEPLQALRRDVVVPWAARDWRDRSGEAPGDRLSRYLEEDLARPFRLGKPPLLRLLLARRGDDSWWLVWTYHHLLLDGWSMSLVLREVFTRYRAAGPDLPAAPYRRYVDWLYGQDQVAAERFWRRYLAGFEGRPPLPGARAAPSGEPAYAELPVELPEAATAALRGFCQRHGLTVGTVGQAAWALLLSRYSGRSLVTFGAVTAGRPPELPDFETMVGLFSTTLPASVEVDPDAAPHQWLAAVQADLADIREYEYSALTRIARWAGVAGAANLFDSIVAVETRAAGAAWTEPGEGFQVTDVTTHDRPHFPVAVSLTTADRLRIRLHVDRRWYSREAAERLGDQLRTVLTELTGGHRRTLAEVSIPSTGAPVAVPGTPATPATPATSAAEGARQTTRAERVLAEIWAAVLEVDHVGVDDNFFELGGDSIMSLLIVSRAARERVVITPGQLLEQQTVAALARMAEPVPDDPPDAGAPDGRVGAVPLTPAQHRFFARQLPHPEHWNGGMWFAVPPDADGRPPVDPDRLAELLHPVFAAIVTRHEALRTGFRHDPATGWTAAVAPPTPELTGRAFTRVRVAGDGDWKRELNEIAEAAQWFPLDQPPLLRALLVDGGRPDRLRLLLVAHHLVVDGVSWRVLLEDLQLGLGQAAAGEPVQLPPVSTSYPAWAEALTTLATSPEVAASREFWRTQGEADEPGTGPEARPATEGEVRHISVQLSRAETRKLLQELPGAYQSQVEDAVLAALGASTAGVTGQSDLVVALETHGREPQLLSGADLTRAVGQFSAVAPVRLRLPAPDGDPGPSLIMMKEQLRRVPHRGASYGVLRYLAHAPELAEQPEPAVAVGYLGPVAVPPNPGGGSAALPLAPAPDVSPLLRHPANPRPYPLEIAGVTTGENLRLTFSYSPTAYREPAIRTLAEGTITQLRRLVDHCGRLAGTVHTPSDFPESGLDQQQLDLLLAEIDRAS